MSYTSEDVLKATNNLMGITIPVHVELQSTQVVLSQPEMRDLLRTAEIIAVGGCVCREGARKCSNPLESCLSINSEAREKITDRSWREISLEDALHLLEKTYKLGLVHLAYQRAGNEGIRFVCSCCQCCCQPLNALKNFDYHDGVTESAYQAVIAKEACIGCGKCVDRCPFSAFAFPADAKNVAFDSGQCFGCGLCVETCPSGAISFEQRRAS